MGHQVCATSPWEPVRVICPNPQLMLCYTVESGCCTNISLKIYYLWKLRRNILLPMNRAFCFWDCVLFYPIWSPLVWLWLWQKADSVPRCHQLSSDCPVSISQFCVALSSGVLWLRLFSMMFDGFPSCLACCVWRGWINQWAWKMCKLKLTNSL